MGRKIEFFHYLHNDANVDENVEIFQDALHRDVVLGDVDEDTALKAVDKFYEDRPFYEIRVKVILDVDTGMFTTEIA